MPQPAAVKTRFSMRYPSKRKKVNRRVVVTLLAVSVVGLALPTSITGRLMNLVQVLVPIQDGAGRVADGIGDAVASPVPAVSGEEHQRALARIEALRRTVAALSARVANQQKNIRQLTGIRALGAGPNDVLIPARLVAGDVLPFRESGLIDAGVLRGVRPDAAVTSRDYGLDVGQEDGAAQGMAVLSGQVLLGWVIHAGSHTARVRLLSDPAARPMPVAIARANGEVFEVLDAEFWLVGQGRGRLAIIDVDHGYVEGEPPQIAVGDVVITPSDDPRLGMALTIGTVQDIQPDPQNQLLYILAVESAAPQRIRQVFVLGRRADLSD
ncbi:MAG: rod shape-determining protein MreC [Phycisphaerae bacterium]